MKLSILSVLLSGVLLLVLPAVSCGKRLPEDPGARATVHARIDWSACSETPEGMTVLIYGAAGRMAARKKTVSCDAVSFRLTDGTYRAAVFSYGEDEWQSLQIRGLDNRDTARAEETGKDPSMLSCGIGEPFCISSADLLSERDILLPPLQPHDIVYRLRIIIHIDGIRALAGIRTEAAPSVLSAPLFSPLAEESDIPLGIPCVRLTDSTAILERGILSPPGILRTLHLSLAQRDGTSADTVYTLAGRVSAGADGIFRAELGKRPEERMRLQSADGGSGGFEAAIGGWTEGEETEIILN